MENTREGEHIKALLLGMGLVVGALLVLSSWHHGYHAFGFPGYGYGWRGPGMFGLFWAFAAALLVVGMIGVLVAVFIGLLPVIAMVGAGYLLFRAFSGHGPRWRAMNFRGHGPGRMAAPVEQGIFCPSCNHSVSRQWATCPHCGYRKYLAPDLIQRRCATCGTELQKDWNACPYCSTRIDAPLTAPAPGPAQFPQQPATPVYQETGRNF